MIQIRNHCVSVNQLAAFLSYQHNIIMINMTILAYINTRYNSKLIELTVFIIKGFKNWPSSVIFDQTKYIKILNVLPKLYRNINSKQWSYMYVLRAVDEVRLPASGCFKCHYYLIRVLTLFCARFLYTIESLPRFCSVGVGVFVTGLSQISSFFSYKYDRFLVAVVWMWEKMTQQLHTSTCYVPGTELWAEFLHVLLLHILGDGPCKHGYIWLQLSSRNRWH